MVCLWNMTLLLRSMRQGPFWTSRLSLVLWFLCSSTICYARFGRSYLYGLVSGACYLLPLSRGLLPYLILSCLILYLLSRSETSLSFSVVFRIVRWQYFLRVRLLSSRWDGLVVWGVVSFFPFSLSGCLCFELFWGSWGF